ncbi:gntR-family transcriptional regulator [Mycobacterium kansasii]|uniref:GntR-family transcriptional regulator n=1 Tax=Mycobacterium kansasii TaxID=1768 RepID=A0A1V3WI85_MYCKA|nr:gntR-family transcriptional regulator [Mycobacterium kansasii]
MSADRATALGNLLAARSDDVLLVEDDHCAGIAGAPLHTLAGSTEHWVLVRSASKAYGPTCAWPSSPEIGGRSNGCRAAKAGPGWVSHLLQDLAVTRWSDKEATRLIRKAERRYADTVGGYVLPWPTVASLLTADPG